MLSPNTILRDRYRIIHELGRGGMGAVYQAMDENLSCVVAVKETFATNEEQRRAFRREAQLLANLNHPTLPRVIEHFSHGEGQFLVMQFVPGHDLAELLKLREQPFTLAKVLDWADQILDALEELHSSNPPVVHRDIKPSNLKVTPKDRILLLDFGLAKGAAGQMSTADADSGVKSIYGYTPNYAPVEQIRGAGTDPRSDLYSLAATLWTLLTGKVPPDAFTRMAEKEEGHPDPLRPAHELTSQVPHAVSAALNRALAVNRNQRFANAHEFRQVLREAREGTFESSTLALPEGKAVEPIHTAAPRLEPTIRTPGPESVPLTPAASTHMTSPPESPKSLVDGSHLTTIGVALPPSVPTVESPASSPTVAPSPISGYRLSRLRLRPGIIAAGVSLIAGGVLLIAIVTIGLAVWRPWSNRATSTSSPRVGTKLSSSFKNQTGMEFVLIPLGSFMMGSNNEGLNRRPVHKVTINYSFYMGKYEVTQAQWQAVMGNNPSRFQNCGGGCPVERVSWDDAQFFIGKMNQLNDGYTYRLPTEAEWEYACRAGTTGDYAGNLSEMAWYSGNSGSTTYAVGSKRSNDWGLYDMLGNVWEWCEDWEHTGYDGAPIDGSAWLSGGGQKYRVLRGGSWSSSASYTQLTFRGSAYPNNHGNGYGDVFGFRVVATPRAQ